MRDAHFRLRGRDEIERENERQHTAVKATHEKKSINGM